MHMPNPTMPQAKFFFVYIMWKDEDSNPLQTHVAFGFEESSIKETRRLIISGAQISQLLYCGPVCLLESHHRRDLREVFNLSDTNGGTRPPFEPASKCPRCEAVPLDDAVAAAESMITGGG